MLLYYKIFCISVTVSQLSILVFRYNIEYSIYYTVTGVLNPNNQYNIYSIKYNRRAKRLFLSSSCPKTQPLDFFFKSARVDHRSIPRSFIVARNYAFPGKNESLENCSTGNIPGDTY